MNPVRSTAWAALLVLIVATAATATVQDLVTRGQQALRDGYFEKAAACFKAAIIRDVTDEAAWEGYRQASAGLAGGTKAPKPAPRPPVTVTPVDIPDDVEAVSPDLAPLPHDDGNATTGDDGLSLDNLTRRLAGTAPAPGTMARTAGAVDSTSSTDLKPWQGLDVFKDVDYSLLDAPGRAQARFNEVRAKYRRSQVAKFSRGVEVIATYFPVLLYKYMAVVMGANQGWSYAETDKQYVLMSKYARRHHEFSVDLREVSSPRNYPYVADVATKRTYLTDDAGHKYLPVKTMGPEQANLKKVDTYSVCFPLEDEQGKPIVDKAKRWFYLVVTGLDDVRDVKKLRFPKELLKER